MDILVGKRPLTAEADGLRLGEHDLAAEAARTCDRIEATDPVLRAFVAEPGRRDRLQAEARDAAERWKDPAERPDLYGVCVGVKDIVHVDGLPTHGGSALPAEVLTGAQATVVDRLRDAGALVAGKTVTAEFAATAPGETRNPYDPAHTPGGSSSGSAAAVAAGMVPLAIGTQTIGSVIRPAAYCGVVGFKPTHGRIPVDGVIAHTPTCDTLGFFTSDVAGAALAAGVLCDAWQPVGTSDRLPVVGIPVGPYLDRAGADALAAFAGQVALLRSAGLTVREVPVMADFDAVVAQLYVVNRYELARTHADWFGRYGELYREETAASIRQGQAVDRDDYLRGLGAREDFRDRLATAMTGAGTDLWLAPSATGPAPRGLGSTGNGIMCLPWSNAGWPALNLPVQPPSGRLPLGLQCVALPGDDERLLEWALPLEAALAERP